MKLYNKLSICVLLAAIFLFSLPGLSTAENKLYQYSTIDSLLIGNYDGELTVADLKKHGDTGLGTFNRLDGEMVFIDGEVYKVKDTGNALKMDNATRTPFAASAFLKTDSIIKIEKTSSLEELNSKISDALESENLFYVIRIDGKFNKMLTRSVPEQQKPYPPLVDVVKKQSQFNFKNIEGSLIGIKTPPYAKGIGVPGYHWHFITKDRSAGGHVLNCEFANLAAKVGSYSNFLLQLPETQSFLKSDLNQDKQKDLKKVEKDSKTN